MCIYTFITLYIEFMCPSSSPTDLVHIEQVHCEILSLLIKNICFWYAWRTQDSYSSFVELANVTSTIMVETWLARKIPRDRLYEVTGRIVKTACPREVAVNAEA